MLIKLKTFVLIYFSSLEKKITLFPFQKYKFRINNETNLPMKLIDNINSDIYISIMFNLKFNRKIHHVHAYIQLVKINKSFLE